MRTIKITAIIIVSLIIPLNLHAQTAPQFTGLKDRTAIIGKQIVFKVSAVDSDTPEEELIYSVSSLPNGAVFNPVTRIFSWTPQAAEIGTHEVVFLVSDGESATDAAIVIRTLILSERKVTSGARAFGRPAIYKDNIVWTDIRNNNLDIYMLDLNSGIERPVDTAPGPQCDPAIYNNIITWNGKQAGDGKYAIYLYDIVSGLATSITDNSGDFRYPHIYGDNIVYSCRENGLDHSLYLYNISTTQTIKITNEPTNSGEADIFDNKIVWGGAKTLPPSFWSSSFDTDIYLYDITTGATTNISDPSGGRKSMPAGRTRTRTAASTLPAAGLYRLLEEIRYGQLDFAAKASHRYPHLSIFDNTIFWQTREWNGMFPAYNVSAYNILTGDTSVLQDGINGAGFAIYGDKMVRPEWSGDCGLWMYNISTGEKIRLSTNSVSSNLAMYGSRIVWADAAGEIYLSEARFSPRIISASAAPVTDGYTLDIQGSDFGYEQGSSYVEYDNGSRPIVTRWDDTSISCAIPESDVNTAIPERGVIKVHTSSGSSNGIEFALPALINAPTNLRIAATYSTKADLVWEDNSEDEDGFVVEISADGAETFNEIGRVGAGNASFTAESLGSGRTYMFRVCAFSAAGMSRYSNIASAATASLSKPIIDPYTNPTSESTVTFSGTKEAFTSIWMDGIEKAALDADTTWSAQALLSEGENSINVTAKDSRGGESAAEAIVVLLDTTPPVMTIVTDDGVTTNYPDRLHASRAGIDGETGIAEYSYAIGTSPGASNIVGWSSCGDATEISHSGLNLVSGTTYYFSVKAANGVGLWSLIVSSDGITVNQTAPSINIVAPSASTLAEAGGSVAVSADGSDAEGDAILYKIEMDGNILSDWADACALDWDTSSETPGLHQLTVFAKDIWGNENHASTGIYLVRPAMGIPAVPE